MREYRLSRFALNYNQEVRPGQRISIDLHRDGNAFSFSGFLEGKRCFDVGGDLVAEG